MVSGPFGGPAPLDAWQAQRETRLRAGVTAFDAPPAALRSTTRCLARAYSACRTFGSLTRLMPTARATGGPLSIGRAALAPAYVAGAAVLHGAATPAPCTKIGCYEPFNPPTLTLAVAPAFIRIAVGHGESPVGGGEDRDGQRPAAGPACQRLLMRSLNMPVAAQPYICTPERVPSPVVVSHFISSSFPRLHRSDFSHCATNVECGVTWSAPRQAATRLLRFATAPTGDAPPPMRRGVPMAESELPAMGRSVTTQASRIISSLSATSEFGKFMTR